MIASMSVLTCYSAAVSGGFATVHPNNRLTINAVEAAPLEDFSLDVR
jgi:F0F1-type ATP synthase epsilon subunit